MMYQVATLEVLPIAPVAVLCAACCDDCCRSGTTANLTESHAKTDRPGERARARARG